jgi:hypothetical protein
MELENLLERLRLEHLENQLDAVCEQASQRQLNYKDFLAQALQPLGTWRMVIMALILVFLMLFRPRGIMGLRELTWFLPTREITKRSRT